MASEQSHAHTHAHPVYPNMRNEGDRLNTFRNWQPGHTKSPPSEIAAAGLFYLGTGDSCKCFYCGGGLKTWDWEDDPWVEHAKWHPYCGFLLERKGSTWVSEITEKFPNLQSLATVHSQEEGCSINRCKTSCSRIVKQVSPDAIGFQDNLTHYCTPATTTTTTATQTGPAPSTSDRSGPSTSNTSRHDYRQSAVTVFTVPGLNGRNASMASYAARLATFGGWRGNVKKECLARAGFYRHSAHRDGDSVFCYKCGGAVKNWSSRDDPVRVHAEFFKRCGDN